LIEDPRCAAISYARVQFYW